MLRGYIPTCTYADLFYWYHLDTSILYKSILDGFRRFDLSYLSIWMYKTFEANYNTLCT